MKRIVLLSLIIILGMYVAPPLLALEFEPLTESQVEGMLKGANATFAMRPLNGASSKGLVFGAEIGVAVNATEATLFESLPGGSDLPGYLPAPNLYASIGIPLIDVGIEVQGLYLPTISGVSFYNWGANIFWSSKKVLGMIPFFSYIPFIHVAPRFSISNFSLDVDQSTADTVEGTSDNGSFKSTIKGTTWGLNLSLSGKFPPMSPVSIEPYVGAGFLSRSGSAEALVSVSSGGSTTTEIQTLDESGADLHTFAGIQARFTIFALALEYDRIFDQDSFSGKFSFKF